MCYQLLTVLFWLVHVSVWCRDKIEHFFRASNDFFLLPPAIKKQLIRVVTQAAGQEPGNGYVAPDQEL